MARIKVDNKLNVVVGTKAQVEADNTIPENSIVIVTDEELTPSDIPQLPRSKIDGLDTDLNNKVDKVSGKGLSTNDFTDPLKNNLNGMISGSVTVKKAEQDASGNVITSTYETKIDATSKKEEIDGRFDTAESDIDNLQFDVLENTGDIADLQTNKVPKTTKVIGLDLQDNILLTEFKTALGNATQSVAGLLSAEDKTHLDGLVALLEDSDGNTVVDTIGEILEIFNNYPEGADLVTALNGKVDKVAGKGLSQNDFTDSLKNKLDGLLNGNQYYDKTYIDALKDKNGWESELLGTLSNNGTIALSVINQYDEIQMYAKDTLGVIDNESIRPSLMQSGDSVYFFDDTQAFIMVDTVFGFYAPVGYTLQVVGLKYTELKAIDTTYDNTESEMTATTVQGAIDELDTKFDAKVDKDFTSYAELTTDLSDDDYIVVRDISNNQTKKTKVSTLRQFETDTYEYGVRYIEGQESSTLERVKIVNGEMTVGSATGLVANVGIDDEVVVNSFDNIDIFVRNRVVIGGNTFVRVNKYYIREYSANEGGTIYVYTLMCAKKLTGYRLPIRFDNGDGTEKDYAYLSAYEGYIDENGVARSISGVLPTTSISRGNARRASRKNDGDGTNTDSLYGIKDQAEYNDLVAIPIYIEFANKNSQVGIGRGVVDLTFDANTVADSTVANTAIIANNANFEVDMTIYLSTGTYHTITQIDVDIPIAGQTTITFDGATVTPLTGVNLDPRQYKTGLTDSVVASTGFYKANDGKHPFKWRGMENVWGNLWKFVDGVKISNWYAWVSTNPAHYDDVSSDVNGDYGSNWTKLSYQNALANGYTKEMGYDDRFPFARLPIEVGGSSSTYYADYYYQNSGDRALLVGGFWNDASFAGLTAWRADFALGAAGNSIGFRLSYRP